MIDFIVLSFITVILCGYLWLKYCHLYWEIRGIPYLKPESLLFGNNYDLLMGKRTFADNVRKQYNDLAPHKFGGAFHLNKPVLFVRDLELTKRILIKDFHHFRDRVNVRTKYDILSQNLFHITGDDWHILRHKLTTTFTSGKMKYLFGLMKDCAMKLQSIIEKSALDQKTIDSKDLLGRYTIDVISSCAFGLEANSLHDPNSEFRIRAIEILASTKTQQLREILFTFSPTLVKLIRFPLFPKSTADFFLKLVGDTIEYRNKNGIIRNDLLNLLMELQKGEHAEKNFEFTTELLTAQCFIFFLAGYETSSTLLSFILYELAEHPDEQKTLQDEVDKILQKHGGEISYDSIKDMRYMNQVFDETSRLYPALSFIPRICTEDYRIPDSKYVMKKGDSLVIPIHGIHRDPQYFPNPDVFNPENFSHEAKMSRPAGCYLTFGDGPRNCIGMRFGILQVKLALTIIMRDYTVTLSPEMKLPLKLKLRSAITVSENEILLNLKRRTTAVENK